MALIDPSQPLAEVFGFPIDNTTETANRCRRNKLCRFNNRVPSCTKDKANNPLGVCSIFSGDTEVITCPVRFREGWLIADQTAEFFFTKGTTWTSVTEVSLNDVNGKSAGHIDLVLVSYDDRGRVIDFGSVEIQAVYISGNIRRPFEYYIEAPTERTEFSWRGKSNYPKPDFLSSSRKRLIPQVLYKGGILHVWNKKQAVVLQKCFFETLPDMPVVEPAEGELAWFLYDLIKDSNNNEYHLSHTDIIYTKFHPAIQQITTAHAGRLEDFIEVLQNKLDTKLDNNPPDTHILGDILLT